MTGNHLRQQISAGQILLTDFLQPRGLNQTDFSKTLGWPASKLQDIVSGRRGITPETALVLSYALGTTPDFWLKAQHHAYTCQ